MGEATMMMGDLVLTEAEDDPVMTKLLAEGLQVTAVHKHLLRASPPAVVRATFCASVHHSRSSIMALAGTSSSASSRPHHHP